MVLSIYITGIIPLAYQTINCNPFINNIPLPGLGRAPASFQTDMQGPLTRPGIVGPFACLAVKHPFALESVTEKTLPIIIRL